VQKSTMKRNWIETTNVQKFWNKNENIATEYCPTYCPLQILHRLLSVLKRLVKSSCLNPHQISSCRWFKLYGWNCMTSYVYECVQHCNWTILFTEKTSNKRSKKVLKAQTSKSIKAQNKYKQAYTILCTAQFNTVHIFMSTS